MKKLIAASILFTLLTAAAFAQFKVSLYGDFYPDLLVVTSPTGDAANTNINTVTNRVDTSVGGYLGTGKFDFFTKSNTWYNSELRFALSYKDPDGKYEGLLQIKGDAAVQNPGQFFLAEGGDSGASLDSLLQAPFADWYGKGTVGIITAYVGNTPDRGFVDRYNVFNNFVDDYNPNGYGALLPFGNTGLDIQNVRRLPRWTGGGASASNVRLGKIGLDRQNYPYVSVTADVNPIYVTIAGDLTGVVTTNNTRSSSAIGATFRVSGKKLADLVTFDAIYKIHGADDDTDDKISPNPQPDGQGIYDHAFGLFANIDVIQSLGIGVGYSGYVRTQENSKIPANTGDVYKNIYPYLNGIDLRFQFSGVDKLTVTLNNNISFSGITNDDDNKTIISGWKSDYRAHANLDNPLVTNRQKEISEFYFGLWNALGVNYKITDALTANIQILNRLDTLNKTDGSDENKTITYDRADDTFLTTITAAYSFTPHVKLESGLAFKVESYSLKQTDMTAQNWGLFTFGIPINFKVSF